MNTISTVELKRPIWHTVIMLTLGFWLSTSLVLDWVIMPSLYVSGMMQQAGFATTGYVLFWNFNRLELLFAGLILSGVFALRKTQSQWQPRAIFLGLLLLFISLANTYLLTPQMSAIGMQMDLFQTTAQIPANMNLLHAAYWVLEATKLIVGSVLLNWCWKDELGVRS